MKKVGGEYFVTNKDGVTCRTRFWLVAAVIEWKRRQVEKRLARLYNEVEKVREQIRKVRGR